MSKVSTVEERLSKKRKQRLRKKLHVAEYQVNNVQLELDCDEKDAINYTVKLLDEDKFDEIFDELFDHKAFMCFTNGTEFLFEMDDRDDEQVIVDIMKSHGIPVKVVDKYDAFYPPAHVIEEFNKPL